MAEPTTRDPGELLPLTHLTYHILLALRERPLHGYGVVKSVKDRSRGAVSPGTGTFYSALARMQDERLLEEVDEPDAVAHSDDRRRYYALTPFGRTVLAAETNRLRDLVAWAESPAR